MEGRRTLSLTFGASGFANELGRTWPLGLFALWRAQINRRS